ncbi:MAG: PrsW family intramembrane metalloprotease [Firmicutes bacterium]|nr:PrsW family intramembrane metalloprotease [Bacillota bacterium]
MQLLLLITVSLLPSIGWAWFFREQDIYEKEPPRALLLTFFAGMLAVGPAILLEEPFRVTMETGTMVSQVLIAFLVVGLGEESFKLLAVYLAAYRRVEFNEVIDGMVYAITGALGFAAVENLLYTLAFGIQIAPARALFSSLAHGAFSGLGGYHLGLARFASKGSTRDVISGLALAAFLHGLYNTLIMLKLVSPMGIVLFMGALYWALFSRLKEAALLSPFRSRLDDQE